MLRELREFCVNRGDGRWLRQFLDFQENHRHVVVLRRPVDEGGDHARLVVRLGIVVSIVNDDGGLARADREGSRP